MATEPEFNNLAAALAVNAVAARIKKAEQCWTKAQECDARAQQTKDEWAKQQFQRCANEWRRSAQRAQGP